MSGVLVVSGKLVQTGAIALGLPEHLGVRLLVPLWQK